MSTIKSSTEHLTLNADGSGKDIKFQANGVEKASISSAGAFTSTSIDATKLSGALPAIDGSALTGMEVSFGATLATAQAIANTTFTKLVLDSELWDTNTTYDATTNYRFTVPTGKAGRYIFTAAIGYVSMTVDKTCQIFFKVNGVVLIGSSDKRTTPITTEQKLNISAITDLVAGDYVEVFTYHNSGVSETASVTNTAFRGAKL